MPKTRPLPPPRRAGRPDCLASAAGRSRAKTSLFFKSTDRPTVGVTQTLCPFPVPSSRRLSPSAKDGEDGSDRCPSADPSPQARLCGAARIGFAKFFTKSSRESRRPQLGNSHPHKNPAVGTLRDAFRGALLRFLSRCSLFACRGPR